jgi:ABC-type sugar transport system substrate-binding protein
MNSQAILSIYQENIIMTSSALSRRSFLRSTTVALGGMAAMQIFSLAPALAQRKPVGDVKIAFMLKTLSNVYWQQMQLGAIDAGTETGCQVVIRDVPTEGDEQAQANAMLALLGQGFDAVCGAPISVTNLIPAILQANASGVPFVGISERPDPATMESVGATQAAQIQIRFYDESLVVAQYVAEVLGGVGKVAIVQGNLATVAAQERTQAVLDVVAENAGMEVVAIQPADWFADRARDVAADMITAHPDLAAILANNDTMALGVLAAVQAANKQDQILVAGIDGTGAALDAVADGEMIATEDGQPYIIGNYGIYAALKAYMEELDTLPDLILDAVLVNTENVEEYRTAYPRSPVSTLQKNPNPYWPIEGVELLRIPGWLNTEATPEATPNS